MSGIPTHLRKDVSPSRVNMWGVGLVMHDLVMLRREGYLDKKFKEMNREKTLEAEYKRYRQQMYTDWMENTGYSHELLSLIGQCLEIKREWRITEEELHKDVERHFKEYLEKSPRNETVDKLFHGGTEINNASMGDANPGIDGETLKETAVMYKKAGSETSMMIFYGLQ